MNDVARRLIKALPKPLLHDLLDQLEENPEFREQLCETYEELEPQAATEFFENFDPYEGEDVDLE